MNKIERIIHFLAAIATIITLVIKISKVEKWKKSNTGLEESEAAKAEEEGKRKESEAKPAVELNKETGRVRTQKKEAEEAKGKKREKEEKTRSYKIGDTIQFGSYPFYDDGREKAIDWIIIDIDENNNALLISDYALDNVKYNEDDVDITWETSSIRKWLNKDFLNKSFTLNQRSKIIESSIENNDNAGYGTKGGNATTDKLFLLSIEEAEKYFKDDESRIAYPTPYAKSKKSVNGNLYVDDDHVSTDRVGSCWWWLRSPGHNQNDAASVSSGGFVNAYGYYVASEIGGVRAALKINLNNL